MSRESYKARDAARGVARGVAYGVARGVARGVACDLSREFLESKSAISAVQGPTVACTACYSMYCMLQHHAHLHAGLCA